MFAAGVSVLTGILFALVPAMHASRADLQEALNEGGRGSGPGRAARRTGRALVVAEIALAVALVVGAGLVLRSFWKLQQVPAGFSTDGVLTASVSLPGSRYDDGPKTQAFYGTLIERVRSLPGVRAVGAVNALPMSGPAPTTWLTLEGRPRPQGEPPEVGLRVATPDYTRAMGIALVAGRMIDGTDTFTSMNVVVVNQALVDRFFPGQNPIGQRVRIGPNPNAPWRTIVGIVGNVHYDSLETEALPELYTPHSQIAWSGMTLAVRIDGDPMALVPGIRAALESIDRDLPLSSVKPMADVLAESTARRRLTMLLIGAFAAIALTLAIVGVYGVLAYSVDQRRQEIGVRMALGANAGGVARMFVRQGLTLGIGGLAIGLAAALVAGKLIRSFLFGVEPTDAVTYAAVSGIIMVVTAAACYVPARRAARVDPVEVLRR
jgi:putative ABC transport system permease protein